VNWGKFGGFTVLNDEAISELYNEVDEVYQSTINPYLKLLSERVLQENNEIDDDQRKQIIRDLCEMKNLSTSSAKKNNSNNYSPKLYAARVHKPGSNCNSTFMSALELKKKA
jgi:hypothetical protein